MKRTQVSTTKAKKTPAELTVTIDLPSVRVSETVYNTLLPETRNQPRGFRSRTTVRQNGRVLTLSVKADDIVALRAASNTYLRFVAVALKTLNIFSPFYRAKDGTPDQLDNLGNKN